MKKFLFFYIFFNIFILMVLLTWLTTSKFNKIEMEILRDGEMLLVIIIIFLKKIKTEQLSQIKLNLQ